MYTCMYFTSTCTPICASKYGSTSQSACTSTSNPTCTSTCISTSIYYVGLHVHLHVPYTLQICTTTRARGTVGSEAAARNSEYRGWSSKRGC